MLTANRAGQDFARSRRNVTRTRFIEHRGTRILFLDFSEVQDKDEALRAIFDAWEIIRTQPPNSLLTLTYVKNSRFDTDIVNALKELAQKDEPFVKAGAVVGLSGLQRVVYRAVTYFSGRHLPAFEEMEEAKDWLVEQAGGS